MDIYNDNQNPIQPLSKSQKISIAVLAALAVLTIVFWYAQFKKTIRGEWGAEEINNEQGGSLNENNNSEEELRAKDTDKDGLSDWDELNLYKTSPYLEDSDSDGFSDKIEIDENKDPNCPAGRDCSQATPDNFTSTSTSADNSTSVLPSSFSPNLNIGTTSESALNSIFSGVTNAATLRKMLLGAGMDKNLLDQISDEELLKSYKEILGSQ
jgi:hypothetical protein